MWIMGDDENVGFWTEGRVELELKVEAYWRRRTDTGWGRKPCFR
jgi:hypothetical protein